VPSRVSEKEGLAGMFRLIPAVPETFAVVVSVDAIAAVAATSATAAIPMMMLIRCLMIFVFSLKGLAVLDKPTIGRPGENNERCPV